MFRTTKYEVHRLEHGIAVFGAIALGDFSFLVNAWAAEGFKILRLDIASAIGAVAAVVRSDDDAAAWKRAADIRSDHPDWLRSGDTGTSSLTILATFTGNWQVLHGGEGAPPCDADDFGRCFRLLERYPQWRERIGEVSAKCPRFSPLVPIWSELETLYKDGKYSACSQRITAALRRAAA
jgi:hypothetical protein